MRGTIKLWLAPKSYGFVTPADGGRDIYFTGDVLAAGTTLANGDAVEYELMVGTKIPQASSVKKVGT